MYVSAYMWGFFHTKMQRIKFGVCLKRIRWKAFLSASGQRENEPEEVEMDPSFDHMPVGNVQGTLENI